MDNSLVVTIGKRESGEVDKGKECQIMMTERNLTLGMNTQGNIQYTDDEL